MIELNSIIPLSKDQPSYALGIDFGTTFCCVAQARGPHDVETIGPLIPSVVAYTDQGEVLVGNDALSSPWPLCRSVKRSLNHKNGTDLIHGRLPLTIAIDLFRGIKKHIIHHMGHFTKSCVLTVPAYFDETQRTIIKGAAQEAGFEVLRLISEPSAAALMFDLKEAGLYGVYDLGGGTFDFSLLKMQHGLFRVLATGGIADLGGDDLDQALADHLPDINLQKARTLKEQALVQAEVSLPVMEALYSPLIQKTVEVCQKTLGDVKVKAQDLKGILLVGGSSRLWMVAPMIEKALGLKPSACLDPDRAVAMGAALHAYYLTHAGQFLLLDVNPLSLGLETLGGFVQVMIPRHTPLPACAEMIFATGADGQTALELHLLQGEQELAKNMRRLGSFVLKDLPPLPQAVVRVKVQFLLDEDGLLTLIAHQQMPHEGPKIVWHLNTFKDLTCQSVEEEVERAGEDFFERRLLEAQTKAQSMLDDIHRLFCPLPPELSEFCDQVKEKIVGQNPLDLESAMETLSQALLPLMENHLTEKLKNALESER